MLVQVVGDDLLMSNAKRIERAIVEYACNALLLKVTDYNFNKLSRGSFVY